MEQSQIDTLNGIVTELQAFIAANPVSTSTYTPTEAEVQAAVDAGVIAAYTPVSTTPAASN